MRKTKNIFLLLICFLVTLSMEACKQNDENENHGLMTPMVKETVETTKEVDPTERTTIEISAEPTSDPIVDPTQNTTVEPDTTKGVTVTPNITKTPVVTLKPTATIKPTVKPTMKPTATSTPELIQETEDVDLYSFSDEEIAEMAHMYVGCPHNNDNGPEYYMTIEKITKTNAKITLNYVGRNGSPLYEASDIDVKLSWGNSEKSVLVGSFDWNDSWGNAGTGTIMIEKDPFAEPFISLNVKQTYTAETNRATLDTKGDKTFVTYFYYG